MLLTVKLTRVGNLFYIQTTNLHKNQTLIIFRRVPTTAYAFII